MKLLTASIEKKLLENGKKKTTANGFKPVVKFFFNSCTWLITDMDEDGIMFGLCDLGMGSPELGCVSLDELKEFRTPFGTGIERDLHFTATKTVGEYADEARASGMVVA